MVKSEELLHGILGQICTLEGESITLFPLAEEKYNDDKSIYSAGSFAKGEVPEDVLGLYNCYKDSSKLKLTLFLNKKLFYKYYDNILKFLADDGKYEMARMSRPRIDTISTDFACLCFKERPNPVKEFKKIDLGF